MSTRGFASYTSVRLASTRADLVAAARLRASSHATGHEPTGGDNLIDIELDEHDASAVHFLAFEDAGPVATVRLLAAEVGEPLPFQATFGLPANPEGRAAELSHPAVRPDRVGDTAVLMGLLRASYDQALAAGVEEIYLVADQPLLTLLRGHGFRFRAVSGPMWANGSWSIAAVLAVDEILPGLRLHQAVHGCRVADFFTAHFNGNLPGHEICDRQAG